MTLLIRDIDEYLELYAPNRVRTGARVKALQRKFAKFVAERYRQEVRDAVIRQSLADSWKPLSRAYREHKIQTGLNPGMWIATSKLINSIVVIETPGRIEVGVDKRKKHTESGVYLTTIVKAMEYGAGDIPPRPLFTPIFRNLVRSMPALFKEFLRKEGLT